MAANATKLHTTLHRIANKWPVDPLRTELSFNNFLRARAATLESNPNAKFGNSDMQAQVKALEGLVENSWLKKYPITDRTLKPASKPEYYEKLRKELEEAPGRSWLQGLVNSWKGYIRMK
ncbi:hypothetical protein BDZ91DRAFT_708977 [Kalaharituber pfeilii]|nr:hypothetical protein BDZ91DRAFT_708977 [Kalaharituber pfeilii]